MLFSTLHSLFLQKLHFQLQMSTCILKKKNYLDRMMKKRKKVLHLENRNINKWLCTIDIDNSQNGYAKCLQQLLWMEELAISKCTGDKLESFCPFFISRLKYDVINDVRVLRDVEKSILIGETATFKKITSKESLLSGLRRDAQDFSFHYYLRIHMKKGDGDITDLQYLALMIQTMPEIQSRIAVRFMENADSEWSTNDYFRVSHYLRFFQKKYDCLYACYDEDIYSLRALQDRKSGTQSTFLPLLEIDKNEYEVLTRRIWMLTYEYDSQDYKNLYTAIKPYECNDERTMHLFRIAFRMLFNNLPGRKYNKEGSKCELLKLICDLVNELQGVNLLDMLLFGALVGNRDNTKLEYNQAKELFGKVQMLSISIGQILENIVNHSERNIGVFTFRIQKNTEYLEMHYPEYPLKEDRTCLEILIADSNRSDNIVQHFLNSDKADSRLKDLSEKIILEHLFGEFKEEEMRKIWNTARKEREEMCHGLRTFAKGVLDLNGAIRVRSAAEISSIDFKNIFYHNGISGRSEQKSFLEESYIPGTQFSIALNRYIR